MGTLARLADQHDVAIVEDAAQAIGSTVDGRPVGGFGLGCFSLYATKTITSGEGGVVTTNDPDLADRLRLLRNQGMRDTYDYVIPGLNHRMTDLQAAVALPQLGRLTEIVAARRRNAAALREGLADIPGVTTPSEPRGRHHAYHQFTIRITSQASLDRDALAAELTSRGIGNAIYYPRLMFDYPCFRANPRIVGTDVPIAQRVTGEVLSIPVHQHLEPSTLGVIVDAMRKLLT